MLTIYFGYSHVYSIYKNYIRETHKLDCDNTIQLKNDTVMRLSRQISLLDRINNLLDTIIMLEELSDLLRAPLKNKPMQLENEATTTIS